MYILTDTGFSQLKVRMLHLHCSSEDKDGIRAKIGNKLSTVPASVQQLVVSDHTLKDYDFQRTCVFPAASDFPLALSNVVYLGCVVGLTTHDWRYLFNSSLPPVFAPYLTHLALQLQWKDRAAASTGLLLLPTIYPSLTHQHISVRQREDGTALKECVRWDAAVRTVRTALCEVWRSSVAEVAGWREDVRWRRSVGAPLEMWRPEYSNDRCDAEYFTMLSLL